MGRSLEVGSDSLAAIALDRIPDPIAVLDRSGTIVMTNAAWRAGSDEGGGAATTTSEGVNYLDVCERSDAGAVAEGIRDVLSGDRPRYEVDYPCHSPLEQAWFALEVSPLGDPVSGAVLTHTNITARIASDLHMREWQIDPVTMLATSPSEVTGLNQKLADARARDSSVAVVTVTLGDLVEIESRHGRRCRDDLVVHVVARMFRLARDRDTMMRPSTNQVTLFASVADSHGAQFIRDAIARALEPPILVGPTHLQPQVDVSVVACDQYSTIESLLGGSAAPSRSAFKLAAAQAFVEPVHASAPEAQQESETAMTVHTLPDGYLQAANEPARKLWGLGDGGPGPVRARDLIDPTELVHHVAALSTLSSGAADSYRAQRILATADGPFPVSLSVRRLSVGSRVLAVALVAPVEGDPASAAVRDPFATALVAGTIDAGGAVTGLSSPSSPIEVMLVTALDTTLTQAAHPDDVSLVNDMIDGMRQRGTAAGRFRLSQGDQGWVVCRIQLFAVQRPTEGDSPDDDDSFGFVVSSSVDTKSLVDKIARLERHIRRIGSEVNASDVEMTGQAAVDRNVTAVLDELNLTQRQRDIVERLARGQRVASIATALYVSRSTVRNHLAQVYQVVGVHSQEQLLNELRKR